MRELLKDWHNWMPLAGLGVLAVAGVYYALRHKAEDPDEIERQRRSYLNRIGRVAEGHILEINDLDESTASQDLFGSRFAAGRGIHSAGEGAGRILDGSPAKISASGTAGKSASRAAADKKSGGSLFRRRAAPQNLPPRKLLFYTYAISGVTYETAQDITGLEERAHMARLSVGQIASVKYDPANPSNSILLADDWSGLR